jgi:hypothetical protein
MDRFLFRISNEYYRIQGNINNTHWYSCYFPNYFRLYHEIAIVHGLPLSNKLSKSSLILYEFGFIGILALIMSLVTRITEWDAKFILFIIIGWFVPTLIIYLKNRKTQKSDTITINAILILFFKK